MNDLTILRSSPMSLMFQKFNTFANITFPKTALITGSECYARMRCWKYEPSSCVVFSLGSCWKGNRHFSAEFCFYRGGGTMRHTGTEVWGFLFRKIGMPVPLQTEWITILWTAVPYPVRSFPDGMSGLPSGVWSRQRKFCPRIDRTSSQTGAGRGQSWNRASLWLQSVQKIGAFV